MFRKGYLLRDRSRDPRSAVRGPEALATENGPRTAGHGLRFVIAAGLLLLPAIGSSQTGSGVITGTVRDASGGAIPGATVRIINANTRGAVEAVSDEQGTYRTGSLVPGTYRLEISLGGVEPAIREIGVGGG